MNTTENTLNEIAIKQLTWKPGALRSVARAIVIYITREGAAYPDEVTIEPQPDDVNCVGTAWRLLTKAGIIKPSGTFRRSTAPKANGRKVFGYYLASRALALKWLERNEGIPTELKDPQRLLWEGEPQPGGY